MEVFYKKYNRREFVHPDPLEFLYIYKDVRDREVAGLIASSLAYGRVEKIIETVGGVLDKMGPHPAGFLVEATMPSFKKKVKTIFKGFRYRMTGESDLVALLLGMRNAIERRGSLNACFLDGFNSRTEETVLPGLARFVDELTRGPGGFPKSLLSLPRKGSACKRLNLFMRWMVRKDNVDPGGWDGVPAGALIIPVDTHMHKLSMRIGITTRKQADMKTALEITSFFRKIAPADPVRYDFALTRPGIQKNREIEKFLNTCLYGD